MDPTGDYTVHFADPDIFFQWSQILQVIVPRTSALASVSEEQHKPHKEGHTSCPICLAPPTAPRMTRCGHIFCFHCILHYLSTSDNIKWVRCPVCFDSVSEKHLKCVKWFDGPAYEEECRNEEKSGPSPSSSSSLHSAFAKAPQAGSTMRMRLMQRPQITTLSLPRSATWPSELVQPHKAPFHFLPDVFNHAKFMLATPEYLITDLKHSLDELAAERLLLGTIGDPLSISFVNSAEEKTKLQIAKANALETPQLRQLIDRSLKDMHEIELRHERYQRWKQIDSYSSPPVDDGPNSFAPGNEIAQVNMARQNPRSRRNLNPPPPSTQTYFFYQAASGLPIFLHPLDIRILFSHFNSYALFPDSITLRVESTSEGTINDDLRKRCKYLGHMPEGTDVVFVEAGLEGVVGVDGLRPFEGPLRMRRSKRKEKEKKDDRARARAEEREEKERQTVSWTLSAPEGVFERLRYPVDITDAAENEPQAAEHLHSTISGAWGTRSFASTLHSGSASAGGVNTRVIPQEEEWEVDFAWHELEQRENANPGKRKKLVSKMIILGGGGGGRRR